MKFLIDENFPFRLELWEKINCIHVYNLENITTDEEIWNYAKERDLIIVTKDADFSNKIIFSKPPPKVIHLKIGNLRLNELAKFLNQVWESIVSEVVSHKLVNVYTDRIESLE